MPANKKSSGVPKTAVRCALITAATVATLMGAQTLAFSQSLKDLQTQQAAAISASTLESTQQAITVATSDGQTAVLVTPLPSQTPSATATATTQVVSPKLATQTGASPTTVASQTSTATSTTTATQQPTATATKVVTATKQPTAVVATVKQPAPSTKSSRR